MGNRQVQTISAGRTDMSSATDPSSYSFSTGLDTTTDPSNSLGADLMGPNAGTLPNGYTDSISGIDLTGPSSGSMNGNYSFSMPGSSMSQLQSQSLNPSALSSALAAGSKINQPQSSPRSPGGPGRVAMHQVVFDNPMQNFAGSVGGTAAGNSLIELLSKYHPGAQ
jgi:hypothetical protein